MVNTMSMPARRATRVGLTALLVVALAGCSTPVGGTAVKAAHDLNADGADLAVLDAGNYPTAPRAPKGAAGELTMGIILEGHRLANNVVLPTDVDTSLTEVLAMNVVTMQQERGMSVELPDPAQQIVTAHNLLAGFATGRRRADSGKALINMVLRFPDPAAAADTAQQLLTQVPAPVSRAPIAVPRYETTALSGTEVTPTGRHAVEAFLPHGPYLLYAWGESAQSPDDAAQLVAALLDRQIPKIDAFVPTDAAKLVELPIDAAGYLNRVLPADKDARGSVDFGGFTAYAALHFESDPVQAKADFTAAGVDAVVRLRTSVYRARDAAGAQQLRDAAAKWALAAPGARASDGVNGLPSAKCFEFTKPDESRTPRFGCFATANRYQVEAWSEQARDVRQQVAAQYLMLTG
jgi:hypothetical protein